jgi:hypothetical protein
MQAFKISLIAMTLGLMSFSVVPSHNTPTVKLAPPAAVVWKVEAIELGQIPQGTPKTIEFEFKNTSDKAVIITNVKPACGCTTSDYSKQPIAPSKSGYVKAIYNAAALGSFSKTVTVTTNADETPKVLTFKGTVTAKS